MISSKVSWALKSVPKAKRYVIALSGGLDSALLLKSFRLAHPSLSLKAIHVHHGLSANADAWADHCKAFCESLSVSCYIERVLVVNSGEGVEAAARKARYEVFEKVLEQGDVLLQGHHQNDQAETVLLRALRGSSVKALSAIPKERVLTNGAKLYRPWLSLTRKDLEQEAKLLELQWVEDESNGDDAFDRNFIRQNVLPVIQERWPKAIESLVKVAENAYETQRFIEEWCSQQFNKGLQEISFGGDATLRISKLVNYTEVEQARLLRTWIDSFSYPQPSARIFERIFTELIPAKPDANPIVQWGKYELRRYDGAIYCIQKRDVDNQLQSTRFDFAQLGEVHECEIEGQKLVCSYNLYEGPTDCTGELSLRVPAEGFELEIKPRSGGEVIKLRNDGSNRSLKSLFQEAKVPTWLRDAFPLIYINGDLAAVSVNWGHVGFKPSKGNPVLQLKTINIEV